MSDLKTSASIMIHFYGSEEVSSEIVSRDGALDYAVIRIGDDVTLFPDRDAVAALARQLRTLERQLERDELRATLNG